MSYVLALVRRHAVATVAIVLALTGTAFAAGNGLSAIASKHADARIWACVTRQFGTLNLTTASARCPDGQRKISWSAEGQQGARGLSGAAGAAGTQGPAGPKGDAGTAGAQGPAGPRGDQGDVGPQGPAGPRGDQGDVGPQGPAGPAGNQGPAGDPGTFGADGGSSSELATIADATVVGGADVPFGGSSNLGSGIDHTDGTTTFTVSNAGRYRISAAVDITAGIGSAIAVAVNGTPVASTDVAALVAVGQVTTDSVVTLAAGDVVTLRDNSAIPFVMALAPGVGASLVFQRLA